MERDFLYPGTCLLPDETGREGGLPLCFSFIVLLIFVTRTDAAVMAKYSINKDDIKNNLANGEYKLLNNRLCDNVSS